MVRCAGNVCSHALIINLWNLQRQNVKKKRSYRECGFDKHWSKNLQKKVIKYTFNSDTRFESLFMNCVDPSWKKKLIWRYYVYK